MNKQQTETTERKQAITECKSAMEHNERNLKKTLTATIQENITQRDAELSQRFSDIDATLSRINNRYLDAGIRENQLKVTVQQLDRSVQKNHREAVHKVGLINTSLTAIADTSQISLPPRTLRSPAARKRKNSKQKTKEDDRESNSMDEGTEDDHDPDSEDVTQYPDESQPQDDTREASLKSDDEEGSAQMAGSGLA
jgi:hypothetical protein